LTLLNRSLAVVSAALLLAGCNAGSDSPRASESKQPGGLPSFLKPAPVVVPEGTTLSLVLETSMSSETGRAGDRVVARLAEDVRVGEKVVVPAGSEVRGRVTAAVPSGRVKTRARLAFAFDTLVLDGKEHAIGTPRPSGSAPAPAQSSAQSPTGERVPRSGPSSVARPAPASCWPTRARKWSWQPAAV